MGSVASAWLALNVNPYLGLLIAPFVGLALGYINGLAITTLRVHSFLATIATALIFKGIAIAVSDGRLISVRLDVILSLARRRIQRPP